MEDAIRLEADVVDLEALQQREFVAAAMTRRAELLRQLVAAQPAGIEDQPRARFTFFNRCDVLAAWSMTTLATHTVDEFVETQLRAAESTRRVTTKTVGNLAIGKVASNRFV